ncbi:MAG: hypothetical protein IK096_02410 [Lachnospiraceae bacterium]|nr:hypothetical protein [Lachnospiraceae bacterium]
MIVGYIWQIATYLLVGFSVFLTLSGIYWNLPVAGKAEVSKALTEFVRQLAGFPVTLYILELLLAPLYSLMSVYFCVSIGQLWYKHKIGGAVICFFVLRFVNRAISSGVSLHNMITAVNFAGDMSINRIFSGVFGFSLIYECIWLIVFYLAIRYVNAHQVNLG